MSPSDRDKVYSYIINRFGQERTAYILALSTIQTSKSCINEICRALGFMWERDNLLDTKELTKAKKAAQEGVGIHYGGKVGVVDGRLYLTPEFEGLSYPDIVAKLDKTVEERKAYNTKKSAENPWSLRVADKIKKAFEEDEAAARKKWPELFYYYDGVIGTVVAKSMHPAGIVASPITLRDNYGTFISDGKEILNLTMDEVHDTGLVKYDILGLQNVEIIKNTCRMIGKPYPKSHEVNWNDKAVWKDMLRSPVGIFQFESQFAFESLNKFKPQSITDMCLVTACIRPSGASYRNDLLARRTHKNPSPVIDELLKDNLGYLIYQEDTIKFLQQICGLSGSEADNVRRAIGRKQKDRLEAALPDILEGYCNKSPQPRDVAEKEAREFLQIIEDSASYQFGYNHSVGYCMISYMCAYLRYYYPGEFITAYLNGADTQEDIRKGTEMARLYGIRISQPVFEAVSEDYSWFPDRKLIAKGISSIKGFTRRTAGQLAKIPKSKYFVDVLLRLSRDTDLDSKQISNLISVDFFSRYGNARELQEIYRIFQALKCGEAKRIARSSLDENSEAVVAKYATGVLKSGKPATSYTVTDMNGLLHEMEENVKSQGLADYTIKEKMALQESVFGYSEIATGNPEDRRKLYITDVTEVKSRKTGRPWAYNVSTHSLGSGKTSRLTVKKQTFDAWPIKKGSVIYAWNVKKDDSGFWNLLGYKILEP